MHRIREATRTQEPHVELEGTVEADETYVGGEPLYKGDSKRGRGTDKTPVMVLVERDGEAKSKPEDKLTADELQGEIEENVEGSSTMMTDEFASYRGREETYNGGHFVVKHSDDEYVRGDVRFEYR